MNEILVRVVAPHFVCGLVMANERCEQAAPILAWAFGRNANYLRKYFADKRWQASILSASSNPSPE